MMRIFLTGGSGFVGKSYINFSGSNFEFLHYKRGEEIIIDGDIVLHFAGKSPNLTSEFPFEEFYSSNYELTKKVFDSFLSSDASTFIFLSSVKAISESGTELITEITKPNPISHYGKSKLLAEQFIFSRLIPKHKRIYILRPSVIHGPGNKGNLFRLFNLIDKGYPWLFKNLENNRSFLSIKNLCFVIDELIKRDDIPSGIYNVADTESLSTDYLLKIISNVLNKKISYLTIPKYFFKILGQVGDLFGGPINTDTFSSLTDSYVISNTKLLSAIKKPLPISAVEGLKLTFESFRDEKI